MNENFVDVGEKESRCLLVLLVFILASDLSCPMFSAYPRRCNLDDLQTGEFPSIDRSRPETSIAMLSFVLKLGALFGMHETVENLAEPLLGMSRSAHNNSPQRLRRII